MKNLPAANAPLKSSVTEKIVCILFGVLLVLVALEVFLRLLGFGYNLAYKAPVNAGADYRIYCVGESTTWGLGASDPIQKGYPHQLEELLNEKYKGMKIQCFFDQTIGQNTSEMLAKLPRRIEKYRPQLVIFMVGTNNWWNMDRSNILLFSKYARVSRRAFEVMIFLDQFRVWKLFKKIAFSLGFFEERWNHMFPRGTTKTQLSEKIKSETNGRNVFYRLAEHDIEEMVKICRANRIRTVMCTYPMEPGAELRLIQKAIAKKFKMPLVDNFEVFQKLNDPQAYLWPEDHWHPNDAGYAIVAKNIYNCIVKNGFIETKSEKDTP